MGESVCLLRSFSQPAEISSFETNEVVPHRVLAESVSFGRFASESLQWEKWSAFTQNRYLEEVERFTKPGSVAQKKAFFEAHFKNRAAGRATQTKIENVNVKTSDEIVCENRKDNLIDSEVALAGRAATQTKIEQVNVKTSDEIVCEKRKDNLIDSEVALVVNNGMAMDDVRHEEVSNAEVDSVVPAVSVMDETTDVETGEVKVTTNVENFNSMAVPEGDALDEENSTSLSKERRSSSSGTKACSRSSKLEPSFARGLDLPLKKPRKEPPSSSKRPISVSKNQNRSPREPVRMSNRFAPPGDTDKNIVRIPQNGSRSSTNATGAGKADKKKRSGPSSVQMPLNFASSARQTTKTAPKNLARNSTTEEETSSNARNSVFSSRNEPTGASKSRKRPLPQTSKEGSKDAKCSTNASAVRLPKLPPPKNQLSENKRKNITVGSSVSCRIPNNVQRQSSVGRENLSTHSKTRAKSLTVSSPFNFRSDERAEKRKEFFRKMEEKNKKEDSGKEQLSCGFKASEEHKNPQVGGFKVPLISLNKPRFRRNQTPGTEKIKKSHQTPNKVSSIKIINTKKAVMEKQKSCKIHPASKSRRTRKTQENMSPNIPQN